MNTENNKITSVFAPFAEITTEPTIYKIGGTTYEVTSHFDIGGKETVLEQFEALLTEHKMIQTAHSTTGALQVYNNGTLQCPVVIGKEKIYDNEHKFTRAK